MEAFTKV